MVSSDAWLLILIKERYREKNIFPFPLSSHQKICPRVTNV